jgi:hypothetical protein
MREAGKNCLGVLIVRDDEGSVRHLGYPSEKEAVIETESGPVSAMDVASAFGVFQAPSLRQRLEPKDRCEICGVCLVDVLH